MVFKAIHTAAARAAELERGAASSRMTGACAVAGLGVRSRGWFVSLGVLDGGGKRAGEGWSYPVTRTVPTAILDVLDKAISGCVFFSKPK